MKRLTLFLLLTVQTGFAQQTDTIFANEQYNTVLFFPEKIRQGIVGGQNFLFSYNQEQPQYFGLLKASPGSRSNLLILTEDGQIYSFPVAYRSDAKEYTFFISEATSLGNESREHSKPELVKKKTPEKKPDYRGVYQKISTSRSDRLKRESDLGISLSLYKPYYTAETMYFLLELSNESPLAFEPAFLQVFLHQGSKRRNASFQKIKLSPVAMDGFPEILYRNMKSRFLLVLPRTGLSPTEKLSFLVKERNGRRSLEVELNKL